MIGHHGLSYIYNIAKNKGMRICLSGQTDNI